MKSYSTSIACILHRGAASAGAAGTGIVLDERRVLTCAHVINEAIGQPTFACNPPAGEPVMVTVPMRLDGTQRFEMVVIPELWRAPVEDPAFGEPEDIAVLVLRDGTTFPADVAAAHLIKIDLRDEHNRKVRMTGFPGGGPSYYIEGLIRGLTNQGRIQVDPVPGSGAVVPGFSGAGIWDERCAGIVGMLVTKRTRGAITIAYGLPLDVVVQAVPLALTPSNQATPPPAPPLSDRETGFSLSSECTLRLVLPRQELGPLSSTPNVEQILSPHIRLTKLYGTHVTVLRSLLHWAKHDHYPRARFLCGSAGTGKSRLAGEAALTLQHSIPRWHAGFVKPTADVFLSFLARFAYGSQGVFAVIDNAEEQVRTVHSILSHLTRIHQASLRVLFISRRSFDWWRQTVYSADAEHICDSEHLTDTSITIDDAVALFRAVAAKLSALARCPDPEIGDQDIAKWLHQDTTLHCRPIFIMAAAAHAVLHQDTTLTSGAASVMRALACKEMVRVDRAGELAGLGNAASHYVALSAVTGRLTFGNIESLKHADIGLHISCRDVLNDSLQRFYLWNGDGIVPPTPALLAAAFFMEVVKRYPDKLQFAHWILATVGEVPLLELFGAAAKPNVADGGMNEAASVPRPFRLLSDVAALVDMTVEELTAKLLAFCRLHGLRDMHALILLCINNVFLRRRNISLLLAMHAQLPEGAQTKGIEVCRLEAVAHLHLLRNELPQFRSVSRRAFLLSVDARRSDWACKILSRVGDALTARGKFKDAVSAYQLAIELATRSGLDNLSYDIMSDFHQIAMREGRYEKAKCGYETILRNFRDTGVPTQSALCCRINRAVCLDVLGRGAAREEYECALHDAQVGGFPKLVAACWANIGHFDVMEGEVVTAKEALQNALKQARAFGCCDIESNTLHTLAQLALVNGHLDEATVHCMHSYDIAATRIVSNGLQCQALSLLSEIRMRSGDLVQARKDIELCRKRSLPVQKPVVELVGGLIAAQSGEIVAAMEALRQSVKLADRILRHNKRLYRLLYTKANALAAMCIIGHEPLQEEATSTYAHAKATYSGRGALLRSEQLYKHIIAIESWRSPSQ